MRCFNRFNKYEGLQKKKNCHHENRNVDHSLKMRATMKYWSFSTRHHGGTCRVKILLYDPD